MGQWTEWRGFLPEMRYDFKTEPDHDRMKAEIGISLFAGFGLYIALIRRSRR
jgi:hypothetical protein